MATEAWIEAVFAKLMLAYGSTKFSSFMRGQDPAAVKAYWLHELRGLNEADLAYGLDHLPANDIPNVMQFRAACLRRPPEAFRMLKEPEVDPAGRARVLAQLRALADALTINRDPKAWAWKLRARELAGEKLTQFQRQCWREALERELLREAEAKALEPPAGDAS